MTEQRPATRGIHIIIAISVVVLLSGTLAVRMLARPEAASDPTAGHRAPAANVPAPKTFVLADLAVPCWSCQEVQAGPITFKTDLDLLAPLGNGSANAGVWFADFAKMSGKRAAEGAAAMARRVEVPVWGKILPADDPLLREAEPWCDQATMRFYPEIFPIVGLDTELPNLLLPLTYARSWVARGAAAKSLDDAMADYRRAIRLGRLLRQEDVILISDLVGLACVRAGAEGIYERARQEGRTDLALIASVVIGECAPQRLQTAARMTSFNLVRVTGNGENGSVLPFSDDRLDTAVEMATKSPDRRFRGEAIVTLRIVANVGTESQKEKARAALTQIVNEGDPKLAPTARWCLEKPFGKDEVDALLKTAS